MADIRARFDRYDPELLEGHDLARRAEKAGRSVAEQCGYEDGFADGITAARREHLLTQAREKAFLLHGPGPYTRPDPFGEPQPVDPMDEDRLSWGDFAYLNFPRELVA